MITRLPIAVGTGFSAADDSPLSLAIRWCTRPSWRPFPLAKKSHQFLIFWFGNGSATINEALAGSGWTAKPGEKLGAWLWRSPKRHRAEVFWLPVDRETCEAIYLDSMSWLGTKSYAIKQIAAFAVSQSLLGRWLGLSVRPGPEDVICSEGACRIIGENAPELDARPTRDWPWDAVSPEMAYRFFKGKCAKGG